MAIKYTSAFGSSSSRDVAILSCSILRERLLAVSPVLLHIPTTWCPALTRDKARCVARFPAPTRAIFIEVVGKVVIYGKFTQFSAENKEVQHKSTALPIGYQGKQLQIIHR